jgi:hypothetical protein
MRNIITVPVRVVAGLLALSACGSTTTSPASSLAPVTTSPPAPAPTTSPTVTTTSPTTITFYVTGSAPDGVNITYGSTGNENTAPSSGLGTDGSRTAVPWHRSVPFDGSAQYYDVSAQLQGSGDITCKIVVSGPGLNSATVSTGHASGGDSICSAQAAPT